MSRIRVKVISQKGLCHAGHQIGDEIVFDWDTHRIDGRLCLHALYSVMPKIYALAHGGDVAFATNEGGKQVARHACPDGENPLVLELERL